MSIVLPALICSPCRCHHYRTCWFNGCKGLDYPGGAVSNVGGALLNFFEYVYLCMQKPESRNNSCWWRSWACTFPGCGSYASFDDNIGASTNTTTQGGGALYTSGGTINFFG